jgi:transposase-like protein
MPKECPKCKSENRSKDGIVREKQRYRCKECNYRYTVERREAKESTPEIRKLALKLYLEGLGFRSIGRILEFSHVAVYHWIRAFGAEIVSLGDSGNASIVEIDEMHSYIGSKKTTVGYGLLLIDLENGLSILSLGDEIRKQVKYFGRN